MPRKKIVPKQTTIDELVSSPNHKHFNVSFGDLKRFVERNEDLDDNAVVLVQRVEDFYYDENNWKVVLEEGEFTEYDEEGDPIKETMDQFSTPFCIARNKKRDDVVYFFMHY